MDTYTSKIIKVITDPGVFFRKLPGEENQFKFASINVGIFLLLDLFLKVIQKQESLFRFLIIPVAAFIGIFVVSAVSSSIFSKYGETSNLDNWLRIFWSVTAVLPIAGAANLTGVLNVFVPYGLNLITGVLLIRMLYHGMRRVIDIPARKLGKVYPIGILLIVIMLSTGVWFQITAVERISGYDREKIEKDIYYLGYEQAVIKIEAMEHTLENLEQKKKKFQESGISLSEEFLEQIRDVKARIYRYKKILKTINWDD